MIKLILLDFEIWKEKKCKGTTFVFFKNTSENWVSYGKIKIVQYLWKTHSSGVELIFLHFLSKKHDKCSWNRRPSEQPKHRHYTLTAFLITKNPILHRPKKSWLGYNFRGVVPVQFLLNAWLSSWRTLPRWVQSS